MTIFTLHKILISLAIGLGAVLLIYGVTQYRQTGSAATLATGVGGAVLGCGLALYLRWFLARHRRP